MDKFNPILLNCSSKSSIEKHLGQTVAVSGKLKWKKSKNGQAAFPVLKVGDACIYLADLPERFTKANAANKKVSMIARLLQNPPFYLPAMGTFLPGVGEFAYANEILWMEVK